MTYPWSTEPILNEPDVDYSLARKNWRLTEPVTVQLPDGRWITIPENFEWDLASIPRFLWWRVAPNELSLIAPLVHDWLYVWDGEVRAKEEHPEVERHFLTSYTRKEADQIFHSLMLRQGVGRFRAWEAYKLVRLFGRRYWK